MLPSSVPYGRDRSVDRRGSAISSVSRSWHGREGRSKRSIVAESESESSITAPI